MTNEFILQDAKSWPPEVIAFLKQNAAFYRKWFFERRDFEEGRLLARQYDQLHEELGIILGSLSLRAYHCTRLTVSEITEVKETGLVPLSPEFLEKRIRQLRLRPEVTELLVGENRAREPYRRNMIWFCLFPPEQQSYGVQRFFRSWGGESLYADHEQHPTTGHLLKQIGIPCIVEMTVPIRMMRNQFFLRMPQHYFGAENGVLRAEDYSSGPLHASRIVKIHKSPSLLRSASTLTELWLKND